MAGISNLAVATLLLVSALWVWRASGVNRGLRASLQREALLAERTAVLDRLVGLRVPMGFFHETVGIPGEDGALVDAHLIWFLDLDRCPTCLAGGFAAWNALGEDPAISRRILVMGDETLPDRARRALRGTAVSSVSREEIEEVLGALLPSTKVLLDGSRTILMSDSRTATSECGWSFEAQVGALRGVLASAVIRSQL